MRAAGARPTIAVARSPAAIGVAFTGARQAQERAGEGGILFFHDGGSTGGRVRLQRGEAAWVVDVGWLTGQVTIARAEAVPLS